MTLGTIFDLPTIASKEETMKKMILLISLLSIANSYGAGIGGLNLSGSSIIKFNTQTKTADTTKRKIASKGKKKLPKAWIVEGKPAGF